MAARPRCERESACEPTTKGGPCDRDPTSRRTRARRAAAALALACLVVASSPATAANDEGADAAAALLPDVQTVVPQHLQLQNKQQRDILRFSNGIANTGPGPWALRPEPSLDVARALGLTTVSAVQELRDSGAYYRCGEQPKQVTECYEVVSEHVAGVFEFHPAHNHWHIGDTALFEVRQGSPTGPVVGGNSIKTTFCLVDSYKLVGNQPTKERTFWDCYASFQGISSGWVDQYHQSTPGQQLDVTDVPDGDDYYLVTTANHADVFQEANPGNNSGWVRFRLDTQGGNRKIEVTGHSPCVMGTGLCGENATNR
ncbi:MAG TPA: lysyl oxidase family protein [Gaiellaceae bacterium]|nr:lysyl oxidase family protein [Gaiellaceae bacterium]